MRRRTMRRGGVTALCGAALFVVPGCGGPARSGVRETRLPAPPTELVTARLTITPRESYTLMGAEYELMITNAGPVPQTLNLRSWNLSFGAFKVFRGDTEIYFPPPPPPPLDDCETRDAFVTLQPGQSTGFRGRLASLLTSHEARPAATYRFQYRLPFPVQRPGGRGEFPLVSPWATFTWLEEKR